jgi:hypothetical protein
LCGVYLGRGTEEAAHLTIWVATQLGLFYSVLLISLFLFLIFPLYFYLLVINPCPCTGKLFGGINEYQEINNTPM